MNTQTETTVPPDYYTYDFEEESKLAGATTQLKEAMLNLEDAYCCRDNRDALVREVVAEVLADVLAREN